MPASTEEFGEHRYRVLGFNVEAEGNYFDLLAFINRLEHGISETLIVKTVNLARDTEVWTASLDLAVYTQSLPQPTAILGSD